MQAVRSMRAARRSTVAMLVTSALVGLVASVPGSPFTPPLFPGARAPAVLAGAADLLGLGTLSRDGLAVVGAAAIFAAAAAFLLALGAAWRGGLTVRHVIALGVRTGVHRDRGRGHQRLLDAGEHGLRFQGAGRGGLGAGDGPDGGRGPASRAGAGRVRRRPGRLEPGHRVPRGGRRAQRRPGGTGGGRGGGPGGPFGGGSGPPPAPPGGPPLGPPRGAPP